MSKLTLVIVVSVTVALSLTGKSIAITVDSSGEANGPSPALLVGTIADPLSNYTVV